MTTTTLPSWICKVIADSARRDVMSRIFSSRSGTYSIGQSNFGVLNSYNIVHDDDLLPCISNIKPTTLTEQQQQQRCVLIIIDDIIYYFRRLETFSDPRPAFRSFSAEN